MKARYWKHSGFICNFYSSIFTIIYFKKFIQSLLCARQGAGIQDRRSYCLGERQTIGGGSPGIYEKPCQEFLPSLGLAPGKGEGGDGQTGKAFRGKWCLSQELQDELELDKGKGFLCKRCSLCKSTPSVVQGAGVSAVGTESRGPRGIGEGGGDGARSRS